jgi:hypothetical protein
MSRQRTPGSRHLDGEIDRWPDPPVEECPVIPLGHFDEFIVFAMPEGNVREEKAARIERLLVVDLYASAAGQDFLKHWVDSRGKLQRDLAAMWLIRKCREAGSPDASLAKLGVGFDLSRKCR